MENPEVELLIFEVRHADRVYEYPALRVGRRIIAFGSAGLYDLPERNVREPIRRTSLGRTLCDLVTIATDVAILLAEYNGADGPMNPNLFILKVVGLIFTENERAMRIVNDLREYDWATFPADFASLTLESSAKSFQLLEYV
ncbi:hypothetical protein Bhyg_01972, partial [Pseudolycoriella hygida]